MLNPNPTYPNQPTKKTKLKVKCNQKMAQVGFEPWPFSLQESALSAEPADHSTKCLRGPLFTVNRFSRKITNLLAKLL